MTYRFRFQFNRLAALVYGVVDAVTMGWFFKTHYYQYRYPGLLESHQIQKYGFGRFTGNLLALPIAIGAVIPLCGPYDENLLGHIILSIILTGVGVLGQTLSAYAVHAGPSVFWHRK